MQALKMVVVVAFMAILVANAGYMLLAPRKYLDLPYWWALTGGLRKADRQTRKGLLELRLLGAIFLLVPVWCIYRAYTNH